MTKEKAKNIAYGLMLYLGTIQDEMSKGGMSPSKNEVDSMYNLAVELNEYFEE
jgi:hypothetical protein